MDGAPPKLIGIGLPKTGTTTLAHCLGILGYGSHTSISVELQNKVNEGAIEEVLAYAEAFDSFEDWPWFNIYREMDSRFPGSRFVLTVRADPEMWYRSFLKNAVKYIGLREFARRLLTRRKLLSWYETHNREVREYFKSRPDDLLVMCFGRGDGWSELCGFLGLPEPESPFPHQHRSSSLLDLLRRRVVKNTRRTLHR